MSDKRKKKTVILVCSLLLALIVFIFVNFLERQYCMKVPIVSENELNEYIEITELDISLLSFDGEDVAVDFPSNSIYIYQPAEALTHYYTLQGELSAIPSEYSLNFLDTPAMTDVSKAVRDGEPLTLIIKSGNSYQRVNVVITTLPVLYLDFENVIEDETGRSLNQGKLTMWSDFIALSDKQKVTTSFAEWRLRGNSTRSFPKKAWKLNLRDENGENKNLNLLGLGGDDDWILNPMSMDDTKIKEKLVQDLWNQLVSDTNYNYKMSKGEYLELFINGAYQGLYMLQRRIDGKYLELDKEKDILIKGINTWEAESLEEAYEIVSTPLDNGQTYNEMSGALSFKEENYMNINNLIDVSLLVQFISGQDNAGYKNMFYALKKTDNAYELRLVPWDTDLSFGVTWGYNYEESLNAIVERPELQSIREIMPSVNREMTKRWNELRKSVFSNKTIFLTYDRIIEKLTASGALNRDQEKWGLLHEGEDNLENLNDFICERLALLDKYYS